jgi:hypothetical protein
MSDALGAWPTIHTSLVCVCMDVVAGCGSRSAGETKTAGRRRVSAYTHAARDFLTLLLSCSSSSVNNSTTTLHTPRAWLNCSSQHNDSAGVAADG